MDDEQLTRAVMLWTGWHTTTWPRRDDSTVLAEFGDDAGRAALKVVRQLVDDFYRSDAVFTVADLAPMGERAAAQFRANHPEVSEDVVQALEWCYTWDFK